MLIEIDAAGATPPEEDDDDPYVARLVAEYTGSNRKPVSNVRVRSQRPRSALAPAEAGGGGGGGGGSNAGRTLDEQLQMQYDALVSKRRQVHQAKVRPAAVARRTSPPVCGNSRAAAARHGSADSRDGDDAVRALCTAGAAPGATGAGRRPADAGCGAGRAAGGGGGV